MNTKLVFSTIAIFIFSQCVWTQEIKSTFKFSDSTTTDIGYILKLPKNKHKKTPLIVFLHGSGERGSNLDLVKNHSPFTYENQIGDDVALLAPQCPENSWWDTKVVYELVQKIISNNNIDKSRVYLTGLSMGGWGTWKLAIEHPELFAAIAPVCAPVDRFMTLNAKKINIPTRIYHGALDDVVSPNESIEMHQILKKNNTPSELIIFSNDNHNSWDSTYSNPEFYKWLLSNQKK